LWASGAPAHEQKQEQEQGQEQGQEEEGEEEAEEEEEDDEAVASSTFGSPTVIHKELIRLRAEAAKRSAEAQTQYLALSAAIGALDAKFETVMESLQHQRGGLMSHRGRAAARAVLDGPFDDVPPTSEPTRSRNNRMRSNTRMHRHENGGAPDAAPAPADSSSSKNATEGATTLAC
jgi:hypothetical protein